MDVFMAVQVSNLNTSRDNLLNLTSEFIFDVKEFDFARKNAPRQDFRTWIKETLRCDKRWGLGSCTDRPALCQIQMNADAQCWHGRTSGYSMLKSHAVCHKGRAGDNAVSVAVNDAPVHALRQSEIIRIHNQILHFDAATA